MLNPGIDKLLEKVDSRYTLVIATAKRARQLIDGEEPMVSVSTVKPVSIAAHEIDKEKVKYEKIETEAGADLETELETELKMKE